MSPCLSVFLSFRIDSKKDGLPTLERLTPNRPGAKREEDIGTSQCRVTKAFTRVYQDHFCFFCMSCICIFDDIGTSQCRVTKSFTWVYQDHFCFVSCFFFCMSCIWCAFWQYWNVAVQGHQDTKTHMHTQTPKKHQPCQVDPFSSSTFICAQWCWTNTNTNTHTLAFKQTHTHKHNLTDQTHDKPIKIKRINSPEAKDTSLFKEAKGGGRSPLWPIK